MGRRPEFLKRGQPVRLQAFLSRSGVASRRAAEEMIAHGRISVNGSTVTVMGMTVRPGVDRVAVDGEEVRVAETMWIALHKPTGYVTTREDPFGRPTVYDLLPEKYHGLFHVGRLDRDSEGILLLTNDGELANKLLHPSHGVTKEYEVVAAGKPTDAALRQLVEGVELEDGIARAESAKLLGPAGNGLSRLRLVLREGKKREVRRMLDALGHPVKRLVRRRFGPVTLAELPKGKYRVVAPEELSSAEGPRRGPRRTAPAEAEPAPRAAAPAKKPGARKKPAAAKPRPTSGRAASGDAKPGRPAAKTPERAKRAGAKPAERASEKPAAPSRRKPAASAPKPRPERASADERPKRPGAKPQSGRAARPSAPKPAGGKRPYAKPDVPAKSAPAKPARGGKPGAQASTAPAKPGRNTEGRRPSQKRGDGKRPPRG
jgi:23S rRNA pseudouridine2605 synthase